MKLTLAQRRGLDALADADRRGLVARVSNRTDVAEFGVAIYWQSAKGLVGKGLAVEEGPPHFAIAITDDGRRRAAEPR